MQTTGLWGAMQIEGLLISSIHALSAVFRDSRLRDIVELTMRFDISVYLGRSEDQFFERKSLFIGEPSDKRPRPRKEVRDQIAEYVAGFANADGGVLICGIEDDGSVTGHSYPDAAVDAMLDVPCQRLEPPLSRGFRTAHEGVEVLVFEVKAAHVAVHIEGDGYPLRNGDQTRQESVERIRARKNIGIVGSYEGRFADVGIEKLDLNLVRSAMKGAGQLGETIPYLESRRLGDWQGQMFKLRNAALLCFEGGQPRHPNSGVRIFRVIGSQRHVGIEHNVEERPRIEGALPHVLDRAYVEVEALLRKPKRLGFDGRFHEVREYPDFAWKEAILNAVAHRDYAKEGSCVEVWLYDDRMEVRSPGHLPGDVTVELLRSGAGEHYGRNPRVVRVLVDLEYMQDQGEGIPRMFAEMREQFLPDPEFEIRGPRFVVTLQNTPKLSSGDRALIEAIGDYSLSREESRAMLEAFRHGSIDNQRIRSVTGLGTLAASKLLGALRGRNLLEARGSGPSSYYTLHPSLGIKAGDDAAAPQFSFMEDTERQSANTGGPPLDTGGLQPDTGGLQPDTGELPRLVGIQSLLTEDEIRKVEALGARPRSTRLRPVILLLARRKPWSPAELAETLGFKDVRHFSEKHLTAMVADGQLLRVHPEQPTHPGQAYYAAEGYEGPSAHDEIE